ncbi:MAG: 3-hydroxybutyrate dehydrogenase [Xanthomonadales bacterium]|nr:3-hydroxybutyrate dehydrogenase [Xanthomonadales bacterium]MCB1627878.1 3-hydroxybutyrate dehydrogenase [Xanthomonadales bacterium]MCB1633547.1 3-hydroxybutyrate dehydrogenase [Xanthomonadales bacterium]
MRDKVAVITGSTSGIGLGIARQLASAGAHVVLNGFGDAAEIEALRSELAGTHGVQVRYHGADMTQPDQIQALIDHASSELGQVDVLVNNAGIQHTAPVHEFPTDRWDAILAINLSSSFHTIQAVLPQMLERNWGRIVNIASVHGLVASVNKAAYVAAKHGLVGLTKVVALETARSGVTCNAICPGWVLTPLVQKQIDALAEREGLDAAAAQARLLGEKQPSQAFATPEQIGQMVLWLCSEHAAQVRGAALTIDGGWSAQ